MNAEAGAEAAERAGTATEPNRPVAGGGAPEAGGGGGGGGRAEGGDGGGVDDAGVADDEGAAAASAVAPPWAPAAASGRAAVPAAPLCGGATFPSKVPGKEPSEAPAAAAGPALRKAVPCPPARTSSLPLALPPPPRLALPSARRGAARALALAPAPRAAAPSPAWTRRCASGPIEAPLTCPKHANRSRCDRKPPEPRFFAALPETANGDADDGADVEAAPGGWRPPPGADVEAGAGADVGRGGARREAAEARPTPTAGGTFAATLAAGAAAAAGVVSTAPGGPPPVAVAADPASTFVAAPRPSPPELRGAP